jgi:glycogen debranching enzyme
MDRADLYKKAAAVLAGNDVGGWTRPAPGLYPHQWLWDSCFVAIGLSHTDPHRAAQELRSLIRGQWSNGMLPHMIFNPSLRYRLEAFVWGTKSLSPHGVRTSGMAQPPMLAIAVERVARELPAADGREFVLTMLPVLFRHHEWIYRDRDPKNTGLASVLHSWESGMDDSPYWTKAMDRLPPPPLSVRWLREFRHVHREERATARSVQEMLTLGANMRLYRYNSLRIIRHSRVVLHDLVFNCVLAAANEALDRLAESAEQPVPADLRARFAPTRAALEQLWDDQTDQYYSRDARTGRLIGEPTITTFMPLYAGTASPARAHELRALVTSADYATPFPLPSVPVTSPEFEPRRYWRGPVWINMNWFVVAGLERYGFTTEAEWLRGHTLDLIARSGFREYYNPLDGEGLGGRNFSWTAALTLDLLEKSPYRASGR